MTEITIRQVKQNDLDDCFNVEDNCYGEEGATKEKIAKRIQVFPEGFFVAEYKGKIVGIINGTSTNKEDLGDESLKSMVSFSKNGKNIIIFSLAVHPKHQGKGIARLLLEKFIENCKKLKKQKILLMCRQELITLYEKFGFSYLKKSESRHGNIEWHEMHLVLR